MSKIKQDLRPLGAPNSWGKTPGTFIAAQAHINGADHIAHEMELKWGVGRLRLLVHTELREKFDRQRYLFNQAIWHGDLEAVRTQSARMTVAWTALDKAAIAAGAKELDPMVWETTLDDGTVLAIFRRFQGLRGVAYEGRQVAVFSLDEIAHIVSHYQKVVEAKHIIPGATVEAVRRPSDPLEALRDSAGGLDDPLDHPLPNLGV